MNKSSQSTQNQYAVVDPDNCFAQALTALENTKAQADCWRCGKDQPITISFAIELSNGCVLCDELEGNLSALDHADDYLERVVERLNTTALTETNPATIRWIDFGHYCSHCLATLG